MDMNQLARLAVATDIRRRYLSAVLDTLTGFSEREMEAAYSEQLDAVYGEVQICGYTYPASRALEFTDPVAYRCGFADYCGDEDTYTEVNGRYYFTEDLEAAYEAHVDAKENADA